MQAYASFFVRGREPQGPMFCLCISFNWQGMLFVSGYIISPKLYLSATAADSGSFSHHNDPKERRYYNNYSTIIYIYMNKNGGRVSNNA